MINWDAISPLNDAGSAVRDAANVPPPPLPTMKTNFGPAMAQLDPYPLLATFAAYEPQITGMEEEVAAVKVTNEPTAARAVSMAGQTRKLRNEIKKAVDSAFRPVNDYKNAISDVTGKLIKRLEAMTSALESANRAYLMAEDTKRREAARKAEEEARKARIAAEAAARAEAERKQKEYEARLAEESGIDPSKVIPQMIFVPEPVFVPAVVMPPTETKITTADGSMKIEYEMVPEIADFRLLPAECLQARAKEITAAVMPWIKARGKAGIHNDPGIIWTRQPKTQTRVGR
ncbi:MAG TPA: hypothetical protein DCZ95_14090 [Verrucomicrobia bacterium]|nr:hypothetical protein [Verrucomicrobiota bacterium]